MVGKEIVRLINNKKKLPAFRKLGVKDIVTLVQLFRKNSLFEKKAQESAFLALEEMIYSVNEVFLQMEKDKKWNEHTT